MSARFCGADLQDYTWPIIVTLISALSAALYLHLSRVKPSQERALPQEAKPPKAKRSISLRICGIPASVFFDEIEEQLKTIDDVSVVRWHPLLRMDKQSRCTIVDIKTALPETELLRQLNTTSEQSYTYDCDFYGITPLSQDEDTQVELVLSRAPWLQ